MGFGGPVIVEQLLEVNHFASVFLLHPRKVTTRGLYLHAQLGYRRNVSTYAQASDGVCNEEMKDIQPLRWCPSLVVFPLQFSRLTFD